MRLSARNQLDGVVASVQHGAVMSTVVVRLAGGQQATSAITRDSAEALELAVGDEVKAVIKSTEGRHDRQGVTGDLATGLGFGAPPWDLNPEPAD